MEQLGIDFGGGFNLNSIIILAVFAATMATVAALALPFMRGERFEARLRSVKERRRQLSQTQQTTFQTRNLRLTRPTPSHRTRTCAGRGVRRN